jgi:hypothetical protein
VPLLLHETFRSHPAGSVASGSAGRIGRWQVVDGPGASVPSTWELQGTGASRHLAATQVSAPEPDTKLVYSSDGSLDVGHPLQPVHWDDYRYSAEVRMTAAGAAGVVFRFLDAESHYRFTLDSAGGSLQLVRVLAGTEQVLGVTAADVSLNRANLMTVEAIGDHLRA